MRKEKPVVDTSGEVPKWFMTYSDVITLLMTFFILLLTFSTNEPERFERMQIAMFGGGGASGLAGTNDEAVDRDSLILRVRPPTSRQTTRGSEMPPMHSDPVTKSLARGLKALDNPNELAKTERISIEAPLNLMQDSQGQPTSSAAQMLRMLALQLKSLPIQVEFQVPEISDAEVVVKLGRHLLESHQIPPGRISVSIPGQQQKLQPGRMRMILNRKLSTP